jgi:hypothetical protein
LLAVLCEQFDPRTEVVAVEQPFAVPLIDQETGVVHRRGVAVRFTEIPDGRTAQAHVRCD